MSRVSIVGSGWVGTNLGKALQRLGYRVIFHDISEDKVAELREKGYKATTDLEDAVLDSGVTFLSVPTPTEQGEINLDYLEKATEDLGAVLKGKDDYHLVVVKSTVVPGTTESLVIPDLEKVGVDVGDDAGVCMNPEFMTEISNTWAENTDFSKGFSEDRVVIGAFDEESGDRLEEVYDPLDIPVVRTDLKTAEMIKYACNCALSMKISYWNEIFRICNRLDIDSDTVAETAAMDDRIGEYGTVHGKAFGGKCLPKDLGAFINFVEKEFDFKPQLLKAVEDINDFMAERYGVRE